MRVLRRNAVQFWFALYQGIVPITDEQGYETGEYAAGYSDPVQALGNFSAARGETQTREFGEMDGYDKILVLDNFGPVLDEQSRIWLTDPAGGKPHDYIVKKVAKSLNSASYALTKVTVND